MIELLRNIAGYKGIYQISNFGNVRSFNNNKSRILKQRKASNGYLYVNLCMGGKYKSFRVHRLVALEFIGYSDLTVNHKDGNKTNNNIDNLEWMSFKKNYEHAKINGLLASGENNGRHKLLWSDVEQIRQKYLTKKSFRYIAKEYGVSKSVISKIIHNKNWKI